MNRKYIEGNIILPNQIVQGKIEFDDTQVLAIREEHLKKHSKKIYVFPGFIDIHTHGCMGYGVMDASTESILQIANGKAAQGVTHFLPTTLTAKCKDIKKSIRAIKESFDIQNKNKVIEGAKIQGIHLEVPYISTSKYRGSQNIKHIAEPDITEFNNYAELSGHLIHLVTLASEKNQALDFIRYLVSRNIRVSVGHSAAKAQEMKEAVSAGLSSATHIFNGMREFNHYEPGCVGSVLIDDNLYCEIIGDGKHVVFEAMELLFRCKPKDKIMLITDSVPCSGLKDGHYTMSGVRVMLKNNEVRTQAGGMAGSVIRMDEVLRNMVNTFVYPQQNTQFHTLSLPDVAKMLATNQSRYLNYGHIGKIAKGYQANFAIFNNMFTLQKTYRQGQVIFDRTE